MDAQSSRLSQEAGPGKLCHQTSEAAISVEVSDTQSHTRVDHVALLGLTRRTLLAEGVRRASISIALVDDATIHELNRRHLEHDSPTDVISFLLSSAEDAELAGEVILSAEMAARIAGNLGFDPWEELALYLVHGLLHLCGFDDQTPHASAEMRRRESEVLAREGIRNAYLLVETECANGVVREDSR
jgi:probable rRNA maturation factor